MTQDDECFLAREIEWPQSSSLEVEEDDLGGQEVISQHLAMDTEEEDDDLGKQEVTSKLSSVDTEEEEDNDLREQEVNAKLLAMDTEGGEGEGGDQGEETSWVDAFAQELGSLQDCVEEEGEDLLPNPFYQDKWVREWEWVPKHTS